jgi:drug/metabolite transporter (DMT)-like permease
MQAWPVYAYALAMALVATVLPIYAMSAAMARIGSGRTAIVGSFGPVLTIFMGMGLLDERLSLPQWAGVALVMLGVWWVGQRRG